MQEHYLTIEKILFHVVVEKCNMQKHYLTIEIILFHVTLTTLVMLTALVDKSSNLKRRRGQINLTLMLVPSAFQLTVYGFSCSNLIFFTSIETS